MSDTPPRLATAPTTGAEYVPVSGTAVASLAVGVVFVVGIVVVAGFAFVRKQPFIATEVLIFPALGVLLAFTARRQIAAAEGAKVGEWSANAGWWLSVVGGLGYVAYLGGMEFAIRNDAEREFRAWADAVVAIDPANPADPNVYEACYRMQPPGLRATTNRRDAAAMEAKFRDGLVGLRQLDVVRVAGRNRGAVTFVPGGMKEWQQTPNRVTCTLAGKMLTPEGEFDLVVPMEASVEQGKREWQVKATANGFVQSQALTRYGWLVYHVEQTGKAFAQELQTALTTPGQQLVAYDAFVRPDGSPARTKWLIEDPARLALTGAATRLYPRPVGYPGVLDTLFTLPGGVVPSQPDRDRFRYCWDNMRITRAGASLRDSPDANPVLRVAADAVEFWVPIELVLPGGVGPSGSARGRIVLRCADEALAAEFAKARAEGGRPVGIPPSDVMSRPVPWRVVRIESDLKPIPVAPKGKPQDE